MKTKLISIFSNLLIGFVSLWWFIISYATAINIDNKTDTAFLQPLGWMLLILLLALIITINFLFYKKLKNIKLLFIFQLLPFLIGLSVSWFSTTLWS